MDIYRESIIYLHTLHLHPLVLRPRHLVRARSGIRVILVMAVIRVILVIRVIRVILVIRVIPFSESHRVIPGAPTHRHAGYPCQVCHPSQDIRVSHPSQDTRVKISATAAQSSGRGILLYTFYIHMHPVIYISYTYASYYIHIVPQYSLNKIDAHTDTHTHRTIRTVRFAPAHLPTYLHTYIYIHVHASEQ